MELDSVLLGDSGPDEVQEVVQERVASLAGDLMFVPFLILARSLSSLSGPC